MSSVPRQTKSFDAYQSYIITTHHTYIASLTLSSTEHVSRFGKFGQTSTSDFEHHTRRKDSQCQGPITFFWFYSDVDKNMSFQGCARHLVMQADFNGPKDSILPCGWTSWSNTPGLFQEAMLHNLWLGNGYICHTRSIPPIILKFNTKMMRIIQSTGRFTRPWRLLFFAHIWSASQPQGTLYAGQPKINKKRIAVDCLFLRCYSPTVIFNVVVQPPEPCFTRPESPYWLF